jgi:hypothetical protein
MKELTPEQIEHNWNKLRTIINDTFAGERLEGLNKMYDYFEERMALAPASGKEHFHNAHPGGYVEHILHIVDFAEQLYDLWGRNGATIDDFDKEELVFAALHHDLGKVGNLSEDNYIHNDSDWHRKNQGMIYKHNPKIEYMTITDRAIWLLQHFGVQMTENEFLGLRLADGLYEEANKTYYMNWSKDNQLRTNIAYILHQADMMASKIEYDEWVRGDHDVKVEEKEKDIKKKTEQSTAANQAFKELFGD